MEKANLGLELKALVGNMTHLIMAISNVHESIGQDRERFPLAADKLEKVTDEVGAAGKHVMDTLDALHESDSTAAELITRLEPLSASSPETSEIIEGLKKIIDKNQQNHIRILETLRFQDRTSQKMNYLSSLLEKVKEELDTLLTAFGASAAGQLERNLYPEKSGKEG